MTTQNVTQNIETSFRPFKKLMPFDDQQTSMSASFLYTSYSVAWQMEDPDSFMDVDLIAIPFKPASYGEGQDHLARGNESWTAKTRVYQTELTCIPSEIKAVGRTTYMFSTDKCTYSIDPILNQNGTRNMMYIGFSNDNGDLRYHLTKTECKDPNLFLAVWAKSRNAYNRSDELDLNALYCKPSYYYQTHEVTVNGADGYIYKIDPIGERTNFTQEDKIIDIITFEGNVGAAATASGVNSKYFPSKGPDSMLGFQDWGLDSPTGQITYAIGLMKTELHEPEFEYFRDPTTFRDELDGMHKLLFSNALKTLLVDDFGGEEVVGKRLVTSRGIVVVPLIAHILAGCLGLVVVCLGGVFLVSYNRQNNLASDPDTLGTNMALIAHSERLLRDFNGTDECPAPHLCMEPRNYKLGVWGDGGGYQLDVVGGRDSPLVQSPHASCTVPHDGKLVGPVALRTWTGIAVTLVNIALLTLLVILYKSPLQWNGRTRSHSSKIT